MTKRRLSLGLLLLFVIVITPAAFFWARTMIYWWLSPSDKSVAQWTIVTQLIDSANNSDARSSYHIRENTTVSMPHCDQIEVPAPKSWSDFDRRMMGGMGIDWKLIVSRYYFEWAEGHQLSKAYSVNQIAALTACMEATPFGEICRNKVNEVRWDDELSEPHLIRSGFLSKINGEICVKYPEIIFTSQD